MKTTSSAKLFRILYSTVLAGLLAGCSGSKPVALVIRGSNTIGEELAPRLMAEYKKGHPHVNFDADFKGTQYGVGALLAGRCDIGAASRELTTNEQAMAKQQSVEFQDYVIGTYHVVVIVNSGCPLHDLSRDQVRDIFTGVVKNWKDVGGPDAPIHLYVRHPISGTNLGFRELAMENKPYSLDVKNLDSYIGIVQAVSGDAGGIGYSSLEAAKKPGVKVLSIDGVQPTAESIHSGQYPYMRVLRLFTDKTAESPAAHEFITFVLSPRGKQIVDEMGDVPPS